MEESRESMNAEVGIYHLSFMNIVSEGTKSWFINENWNAIFRIDKQDCSVAYIDFPKCHFGGGNQYKWVAKWREKFICISNLSTIPLYIIDDTKRHMLVNLPKVEKSDGYVIKNVIQIGQCLYLFADYNKVALLKFNMETGEFIKWLKWDNGILEKGELSLQWGNIGDYKSSLWSPIIGTNCIAEIDCETFEIIMHRNKKDLKYKWAFGIKGKVCYSLVEYNGCDCIVLEDLSDRNTQSKIIELSSYTVGRKITNLRMDNDTIWLFPGDDGNIIKCNLYTGVYTELQYPEEFDWVRDRRYKVGIRFTCIEESEGFWILYPRTGNGILVVDKERDIVKRYPLTVNMKNIIINQACTVDTENLSILSDNLVFLMEVMKSDNLRCFNDRSNGRIGLSIYKKMNEIL